MARENRSLAGGAVTTEDRYTPSGVFSDDGDLVVTSTSTTSTGETNLNPSTGTSSGNVNDTTIILDAGSGIDGGGSFTTNQASESTISFGLDNVGTPGTFGSTTTTIESITVDAHGRITNITTSGMAPPIVPFNDQFQSGSDAPPSQAASESARTETVTLSVADGFRINTVTPTAGGILDAGDVGTPMGLGTDTVTIDVTIPATTSTADPIGSATVSTAAEVEEIATERVETETSTPLNTRTFLPFYTTIFNNNQRQTAANINLADFTASDAAVTNNMEFRIANPFGDGRPDKYAYFAFQTNDGENGEGSARNYGFAFGTFGVQIDLFATRTMFGRTYNIYEFPTRGEVVLTITF